MTDNRIIVQVPDLFRGFLKEEPQLNAFYGSIRPEAEEELCRRCDLDSDTQRKIEKCNFAFFAAAMVPRADRKRYKLICEWGNWIFPFDDLFDDGPLRDDPKRARESMNRLLSSLRKPPNSVVETDSTWSALISFHDHIYSAIRMDSTDIVSRRYADAMTDYCMGTLDQVGQYGTLPTIDEMLAMRRRSVCVRTLYVLIEYAHEIRVPENLHDNAHLLNIETIGVDLILMHNDILSYRKEESESVPHNLLAVCRMHGMTMQQAVDCLEHHISERHQRLDHTIQNLPSWGEDIDNEVAKFVQAVQNTIKANLYWSFKSGRFLSEEKRIRLKESGELDVLALPRFLRLAHTEHHKNEGDGREELAQGLIDIDALKRILASVYRAVRTVMGVGWH
ncbi:terpenoid synthase [Pseudovirgaria hyperparasitica]|uniref:Terpene synthase n=1 Tax=Pseudovirgaria hyperparasitica TaxID=470096 RepID=A0A6A6WEE8_9PEZI|nr:terpenoid synthase [Pseudovirgaria hyperparasitica]KAF2760256.1 terpenoid synthase [Pseudovirgaria hyperparasitica]